MRSSDLRRFRLCYLPFNAVAILAALIFTGPAIAQSSCTFVYRNPYYKGSISTASTPEAACALANESWVNSIGDTITNTYHLGPLQSGSPRSNNAVYSCPGRQFVTPSDPVHCNYYPG